jgi:L-threonylcarbamoyladenylate synthase
MIDEVTGLTITFSMEKFSIPEVRVSGSLESHYSPKATVILDLPPTFGQGFIALADIPTPEGVIRLASPKNNQEFARLLYASLRAADERRLAQVVIVLPQGGGIAIAIRDRLTRAANQD